MKGAVNYEPRCEFVDEHELGPTPLSVELMEQTESNKHEKRKSGVLAKVTCMREEEEEEDEV